MKIDIKQIAMTAGTVVGAIILYRFIKHEYAEMKNEKEAKNTTPNQAAPEGVFDRFRNYPEQFWNYVDEGFMSVTGMDERIMLGGSVKPVEFANGTGHKIPVATDEPNFAYAAGGTKRSGRRGLQNILCVDEKKGKPNS